jgi:predicted alpha/beta-hydrolase family hydrolase
MLAGILVPGASDTAQGPLLHLAGHALHDRRAPVEPVAWSVPPGLMRSGQAEPFVRAHVASAMERSPSDRPVIIGKSLGSYASFLAAEAQLPAIWLTPLLSDAGVAEAITAGTAPTLLIGGTADKYWIPEVAAATAKPVLAIPDGDHDLRVPGRLANYTDVLGLVATAIEEFLDAL